MELPARRRGRSASPVLARDVRSRVWLPVLPRLGQDLCAIAPDFPGFGCSDGRLERADVPALAEQAERFAESIGVESWRGVAGHDIGGAVAQHLAVHAPDRFTRLALVNSVLYDSWPVPAVARFRDTEVAEQTTVDELLEARRQSLSKATANRLSRETADEYLSAWQDDRRVRSWIAMAAAADARYTLDLVDPLRRRGGPTLLVWGEDDEFQPIEYARRFEAEIPGSELVVVPVARHLPMEDDRVATAEALARFFGRAHPE